MAISAEYTSGFYKQVSLFPDLRERETKRCEADKNAASANQARTVKIDVFGPGKVVMSNGQLLSSECRLLSTITLNVPETCEMPKDVAEAIECGVSRKQNVILNPEQANRAVWKVLEATKNNKNFLAMTVDRHYVEEITKEEFDSRLIPNNSDDEESSNASTPQPKTGNVSPNKQKRQNNHPRINRNELTEKLKKLSSGTVNSDEDVTSPSNNEPRSLSKMKSNATVIIHENERSCDLVSCTEYSKETTRTHRKNAYREQNNNSMTLENLRLISANSVNNPYSPSNNESRSLSKMKSNDTVVIHRYVTSYDSNSCTEYSEKIVKPQSNPSNMILNNLSSNTVYSEIDQSSPSYNVPFLSKVKSNDTVLIHRNKSSYLNIPTTAASKKLEDMNEKYVTTYGNLNIIAEKLRAEENTELGEKINKAMELYEKAFTLIENITIVAYARNSDELEKINCINETFCALELEKINGDNVRTSDIDKTIRNIEDILVSCSRITEKLNQEGHGYAINNQHNKVSTESALAVLSVNKVAPKKEGLFNRFANLFSTKKRTP
jgi:hypothetical protein